MSAITLRQNFSEVLGSLFKGTGNISSNTVEVIRTATSHTMQTIKGAKRATTLVAVQAVIEAIQIGYEAGAELGSLTKDAVVGVIQGIGDVTKVTPAIISAVVRTAIRQTKELGEDITITAKKAVEGAIEAGKQVGLKAEDAASTGATSAIDAALEIGEAAANAVTKALSGTVSGIRIVLALPVKKNRILLINNNKQEIESLSQQLSKEGYRIYKATNKKEILRTIQTAKEKIHIALVDISDFDDSIWEYCDRLKTAKITFFVISSKRSISVQQESIKHSASGVLIKPFGINELAEHIRGLSGH